MELLTKKRKILTFEGAWLDSIGSPELRGSWIVWGGSGSGKTRFTLQLCKYLTRFERVLYVSLEEGDGETIKRAFQEVAMEEVRNRIVLLDGESMDELIERLSKHKSPNVIVIDSLQYTGITYVNYKHLKQNFPGKLFIWISHADGKEPDGKTAKRIRFDSNVKIYVEGFRAMTVSRYGGGKPYTIWEEGADEYSGFQKEI